MALDTPQNTGNSTGSGSTGIDENEVETHEEMEDDCLAMVYYGLSIYSRL